MNHVDLFSGLGGFALAGAVTWREDYHNLGHSDIEEYACQIYHQYFPESECLGDITKINWSKCAGRVDLLTGGFPCQPFSVAGQRAGKEDPRYLWPPMFEAIKCLQPRWIIAENVTGVVNMALGQVLSDLESEGYDFPRDNAGQIIVPVIPAAGVNAPHKRNRVWIVAHSERSGNGSVSRKTPDERGRRGEDWGEGVRQTDGKAGAGRASSANTDITHSHREGSSPIGREIHIGANAGSADSVSASDSQSSSPENPLNNGNRRRGDGDSARSGRTLQTEGSDSGIASDTAQFRTIGGYTQDSGTGATREGEGIELRSEHDDQTRDTNSDASDPEIPRLQRRDTAGPRSTTRLSPEHFIKRKWNLEIRSLEQSWYEVATEFCGVDAWLSDKLDTPKTRAARLKALGNSIQWEIAQIIMEAIKQHDEQFYP